MARTTADSKPVTSGEERLRDPMQRRSDARRTHARIVTAAIGLVVSRRRLTMSALAREAGISRPTLYDHFTSVEEVLEAAVQRAVDLGQEMVDGAELEAQSPTDALARLMSNRWRSLAEHHELHRVATEKLPPERMLDLHRHAEAAMAALVERGQASGDFRTDLPTRWLVSVVYGVLHQAAQELLAGRLRDEEAGDLLARTVVSLLSRPS